VLTLIEEYNPAIAKNFTDDDDLGNKMNGSINRAMFELCRLKKIPKYVEMEVTAGKTLSFSDIAKKCGYEIYQVKLITGVRYDERADGTIFKILEDGTAEIDVFVYPDAITQKTNNTYEFELTQDVLEIMPYAVASDILSTDVSSNYREFKQRYETMLSRLDTRNKMPTLQIVGGYKI
jgi:hypothetical protein